MRFAASRGTIAPEFVMNPAQHEQEPTGLGTQKALLFLLTYLVLYAFLARDWLGHSYDRLPKDLLADGWLIYWILDWVGDSLTSDPSQVFSPPINWPAINQLAGSEHFGSFQVLYLPLRALLGSELAALNLTVFSAYVVASWITAVLLGRLGCSPLVAWVGGLLYGPIDASFRVNGGLALKVEQALPHIMQIAHLFIPWVILGLVRLRDRRTLGNAAFLALALTLAFLSSYYMAVLTILLASLWGLFELVRRSPGRWQFLALAVLAAGVASSILLFVSLPYFDRPEATGDADLVVSRWKTDHLVDSTNSSTASKASARMGGDVVDFTTAAFWGRSVYIQGLLQARAFPTVRTALALFAIVVLLWGGGALSRAARGGLLLLLAGLLLSLPEGDMLSRRPFQGWAVQPPLLDFLRETPARFVRDVHRLAPIFVLGLVVLTSVALESLRRFRVQVPFYIALLLVLAFEVDRRWDPYPIHRLVISDYHLAGLQETGRWRLARFFEPTLQENLALTSENEDYLEIAAILKAEGGGPLIELPADADRPETLVGQRILEEPNIFFYSGYEPPHSLLIRRLAADLPEPFALQDLMKLTDLRWLLVRRHTAAGKQLAEALRRREGIRRLVANSWEINDFVLFKLGDRFRNPEWVKALSNPPEPGETILGSKRVPLKPEEIEYGISIRNNAQIVPEVGGIGLYLVQIVNGGTSLPAARPGRPLEELSVRLRIRWVPVDEPDAESEAVYVPLRRDIIPSSRYFQTVMLANPLSKGRHDLVVDLEQIGNPGVFEGRGKVYFTRFELSECAENLPLGLVQGDCAEAVSAEEGSESESEPSAEEDSESESEPSAEEDSGSESESSAEEDSGSEDEGSSTDRD